MDKLSEIPELRGHTNEIANYLHKEYCIQRQKPYWDLVHTERRKWKLKALELIELLEDLE